MTAEIGHDVKMLRSKRPLVITDKRVANTRAFTYVLICCLSMSKAELGYDLRPIDVHLRYELIAC